MLNWKDRMMWYVPFFYELQKERGLSDSDMKVYGYLWNRCMTRTDTKNGYCGYSNERMAAELHMSERNFKYCLQHLKDAGAILIENEGRRIKKTGESRMIRIKPSNYVLIEEQSNIFEQENEILKTQLDAALKEIEKLKSQARVEQGNWIVGRLYKKGFFTTEEYENAYMYNVLFDQLLKETNWGWCEQFCFRFKADPKKIKKKYDYIASTVHKQIKMYKETNFKEKIEDEFDAAVANEAYIEYEKDSKKSRPISELWEELELEKNKK